MSLTRFETRLQSIRSSLNRYNVFKPKQKPTPTEQKPTSTPQIPSDTQPIKLTYSQRFKEYIKQVALDYKDVGVNTLQTMKTQPLKSAAYIITGCTVYGMYKTNPDFRNYHSALIDASNDMLMIGSTIRNKNSEYYLDNMHKLENLDLLEYKSFVFFSIIKRNNFNKDCDLFEKQCKQLNKPNKWNVFNYPNLFLSYLSSIIDIGLFDYWIFLNKRLKNFDVNDDEWKNIVKK